MNNVSDTYQHITNLIIEEVEAGTKPFIAGETCSQVNVTLPIPYRQYNRTAHKITSP
ncbi:hypothetical protein [Brucella anthropi]|uniref:hypothetical protein n=1 Tax=Brucella anthropi TaxID=529 RepID=UPI003A7FC7FD